MHEFTDKELYLGLEYAKSLDESAGRVILNAFQRDQPALSHTIFAVFPSVIAEHDQEMAHLFMDMCFDIICTFQHSVGKLPSQQSMGLQWLQEKAALVDAEMTAMLSGKAHSNSLFQSNQQKGLVEFMNDCIDEYTLDHQVSFDAVRVAKTMVFVVVQLFCSMYDQANETKTVH